RAWSPNTLAIGHLRTLSRGVEMRTSHVLAALALALLSPSPGRAQTPHDTGTTVIHAGRVFDSELGVMQPAQDILVRHGVIDSVAPHLQVPAGAREIDLRRYAVLPGLIDVHTHLLYLEGIGPGLTMEGEKAV